MAEGDARFGRVLSAEIRGRWFALSGAAKVGIQHVIEEEDLDAALGETHAEGLPERWRRFESGRPAPDPVRALDESRRGR